MTWKGFGKVFLFFGGMLSGFAAGHLFYFERYTPGMAMFALAALFLFYGLADLTPPAQVGDEVFGDLVELRKSLADLTLVVAEDVVDGAKRIGRSMPCTPMELSKLEDSLMPLLTALRVPRKDREHILQEFDKLRTRSRQTQGRRILGDSGS
ncbi:MAG: hypothetical protein LBD04_00165 [Synergistaceae bacterium]|jgi:hypothetical protein|nr:hypothetical protein [Synergistaceae bacterium]